MKLYGFPPSPNTWKVRAVAAHIGLPLELALVDLSKGQQRTPDYLALNPTGRTPTLVDGDLVHFAIGAVCDHPIAAPDAYVGPGLDALDSPRPKPAR